MYLGQLPYEVIIGKKKKKKEQNHIPTDSKSMPESLAKKGWKHNIVFQNEPRSINKMIEDTKEQQKSELEKLKHGNKEVREEHNYKRHEV